MTNPAADRSAGRVLVLAPTGRDAALARAVLEDAGLPALVCADVESLCAEIAHGAGAVLVAEEGLDRPATEMLVFALRGQPPWSDLPLLIFPADAATGPAALAALAEAHTITLLQRPVSVPGLVSTVKAALRARARQYELRDVLARLEHDVQQRDRFLAMLGHELRNPLGAIRNALYSLDLSGPSVGPPALVQRNLDVIRRQAALLSRLVDDLLDVSRVTAGKIVLQRSPVDLKDLALRCVQAVDGAATAVGVTVQLEAGSDPMIATGDATRLEQVVMNLIANAIKYTPAGGRVEVELRRRGAHALLYVRDTGVGLSPDVLPHVFDLFMQAEHSLARAQGGLGIGLTLVRSLVELHGGSVAAASEGTGQGSTFTVRLPLAPAAAIPGAPPAKRPVPPLHILVVEDSADNRESLVLLLRQLGHRVDAAEDGQTGLDRLADLRPQVALIDIGLPRLDGYQVAQRARERTGAHTFLIALTGYGQPEDQRRAYQSGFDAHLTKPLRLESLNEILVRASRAAGVAG